MLASLLLPLIRSYSQLSPPFTTPPRPPSLHTHWRQWPVVLQLSVPPRPPKKKKWNVPSSTKGTYGIHQLRATLFIIARQSLIGNSSCNSIKIQVGAEPCRTAARCASPIVVHITGWHYNTFPPPPPLPSLPPLILSVRAPPSLSIHVCLPAHTQPTQASNANSVSHTMCRAPTVYTTRNLFLIHFVRYL